MKINAQVEPDLLNFQERQKLRDWGNVALLLYPNSLGALAARELDEWAHFGYRYRQGGPIWRLVADLEAEQTRRATAEQKQAAEETHTASRGPRNTTCHCDAPDTHT